MANNPLTRALTAVSVSTKRFQMAFGSAWGTLWSTGTGSGGYGWSRSLVSRAFGGTRYDYAAHVVPSSNTIVAACILWICRTFPEAPLQVLVDQPDDTQEPQKRHPLSQLLKRPNPYYSGVLLWYATIADFLTFGNAYWVKVRSGAGRVVELWWVPQYMMQPRWPDDGSVFLSHYDYFPNAGIPIRLDVEDVVHFRYGMDPENVRRGLSPLASLLREIFTDDEAANFTSSILKNLGVPGVVIAPDGDDTNVPVDDLERVKAEFMNRFGGDRRGEPLVMSGKTKVTVLSFSPQQMDLRALRMVPEERISAVLGVQAAVVGLGTGLMNTKVGATMAEMREASFENCIIPMQRLLAEEINTQLLPDFADPDSTEVGFDLTKVRVLQADQDKLHERAREDLKAGLLTRNSALLMIGEEADGPDGEVLYIPNTLTVKRSSELLDVPQPVALPAGSQGALPAPNGASPPSSRAPAVAATTAKSLIEQTRVYADDHAVSAV